METVPFKFYTILPKMSFAHRTILGTIPTIFLQRKGHSRHRKIEDGSGEMGRWGGTDKSALIDDLVKNVNFDDFIN